MDAQRPDNGDEPSGDTRPGRWYELLEVWESNLARVQAALLSGRWPADGWTAPSLAPPPHPPTDDDLARYRRLSDAADVLVRRVGEAMASIVRELDQAPRQRDAARAYATQAPRGTSND